MDLTPDQRRLIDDLSRSAPEMPGFAIARGAMFLIEKLLELNDTDTAIVIARTAEFQLKNIVNEKRPEDIGYHALVKLAMVYRDILDRHQ